MVWKRLSRLLVTISAIIICSGIICSCARRQIVEPLDIMPLAPEPIVQERIPSELEREESDREEPTKEADPPLKEETVFEIVLGGEELEEIIEIIEEVPLPPRLKEKEVLLPIPAVKPKIEPPAVKEEKKEVILNARDVLRPGEELIFGIKYLGMRVGTGALKIEGIVPLEDRLGYHFVSTARSTGIFALLYRVNERLESFMDLSGLYSHRFELHSSGKNPRSSITIYDQKNHLAYYEGKKIPIPPNSHDPISAFYHLRLHPLKVGEEVVVDVNTGKENHKIATRVVGSEKVKTPAGEFDCLVLQPYFKDKDDPQKRTLKIYLTNDTRKIPVLITSKLPFGQVVLSLEEIRGV